MKVQVQVGVRCVCDTAVGVVCCPVWVVSDPPPCDVRTCAWVASGNSHVLKKKARLRSVLLLAGQISNARVNRARQGGISDKADLSPRGAH